MNSETRLLIIHQSLLILNGSFYICPLPKRWGVSSVGLERCLDRAEVTGSNPVTNTSSGCSSARLECTSGGREAGGSNPLIPTHTTRSSCVAGWPFVFSVRRKLAFVRVGKPKRPKPAGLTFLKLRPPPKRIASAIRDRTHLPQRNDQTHRVTRAEVETSTFRRSHQRSTIE